MLIHICAVPFVSAMLHVKTSSTLWSSENVRSSKFTTQNYSRVLYESIILSNHLSLFDDFRVISEIFSKVDLHIEEGNLLQELNMSALPNLYDQFVQLIELLVLLVIHI